MSAKSIFEADGKAILNYHLTRAPLVNNQATPLPRPSTHNAPPKLATLHFDADADVKGVLDQAEATYPWLLAPGAKFVAKPDQLIKRRGKSGLLCLNKPWSEARAWVEARAGKPQQVEAVEGVLRHFLVEPFVPHPQDTEYYICIQSLREVCVRLSSFVVRVMSMAALPSHRIVWGRHLRVQFGGRRCRKVGAPRPGRGSRFCIPRTAGRREHYPDPPLWARIPLSPWDRRFHYHMPPVRCLSSRFPSLSLVAAAICRLRGSALPVDAHTRLTLPN